MKLAATVAIFVLIVLPMAAVGLWTYATISTCGWRGLFVECRVMACLK